MLYLLPYELLMECSSLRCTCPICCIGEREITSWNTKRTTAPSWLLTNGARPQHKFYRRHGTELGRLGPVHPEAITSIICIEEKSPKPRRPLPCCLNPDLCLFISQVPKPLLQYTLVDTLRQVSKSFTFIFHRVLACTFSSDSAYKIHSFLGSRLVPSLCLIQEKWFFNNSNKNVWYAINLKIEKRITQWITKQCFPDISVPNTTLTCLYYVPFI